MVPLLLSRTILFLFTAYLIYKNRFLLQLTITAFQRLKDVKWTQIVDRVSGSMAARQNFLHNLNNRKVLLALDQISSGKAYIATHEGTGQYAMGGPSACGIIAMNCVRHILNLEKDGCTSDQLIMKMLLKETMEDIMSVCNHWTSESHLEVEDVYHTPLFESSLHLICVSHGSPRMLEFMNMLKQLDDFVKTSYTNRSCAIVFTRPPEIVVCFRIVYGSRPLFVVFDSHPRPGHEGGAAFIFNTSIQKTALYLTELLPYDPSLLDDSRTGDGGMQWETQLLGNVSAHYFESAGTDMTMSPDAMNAMNEANFELLAHRLQETETKDRIAAVWKEKVQIDNRFAALRDENEGLMARMAEMAEENERLREQLERESRMNEQLNERVERVAELEKLEDFWERQQSSRHLIQRRRELCDFLKNTIGKRSGRREEASNPYSSLVLDRQSKSHVREIVMPGGFDDDRLQSSRTSPLLSPVSRPSSPLPDFEGDWINKREGDEHIFVEHPDDNDEGADEVDDDDDFELAIRMQQQFNEEDTALRKQMENLQLQADNRPLFSCCICIEQLPTDFVAQISTCGHSFCRECLRGYVTTRMEERRFPLLCPECGPVADDTGKIGYVTEELVREIGVSEETFIIFMDLLLSSVSVRIFCKKCNRSAKIDRTEYDAASKVVSCPLPNCVNHWCRDCQQSVTADGMTEEGIVHSCDGSTELQDLMGKRGWKHCPGCRTPTEKTEGCNHMRCITPGCNTHFCYICGGMIVQSVLKGDIDTGVATHYSSGCLLFEVPPEV